MNSEYLANRNRIHLAEFRRMCIQHNRQAQKLANFSPQEAKQQKLTQCIQCGNFYPPLKIFKNYCDVCYRPIALHDAYVRTL